MGPDSWSSRSPATGSARSRASTRACSRGSGCRVRSRADSARSSPARDGSIRSPTPTSTPSLLPGDTRSAKPRREIVRKIISASFAVLATTGLTLTTIPASQIASARPSSSFEALSGRVAADYALPADMRLVRWLQIGGLTYERYQQVFGVQRASVLGGQVSIYREAGVAQTVIGSHYASITPTNSVRISKSSAFYQSARQVGATGRQHARLMIDPETGRYLWRVETRGFAKGWDLWIDAGNGEIIAKINTIEENHGIGVKADTKDLDGKPGLADDLTVLSGGIWHLQSSDGRQSTSDAQNAGT